MALTGLKGSFPLTRKDIDREVMHTAPGVFTLGNVVEGKFHTIFVGRSDSNLKKELMKWIGYAPRFKYLQYYDAQDAFNKECELFHFLKPRANRTHPSPPATQHWHCLDCGFTNDIRHPVISLAKKRA